MSCWSSCSSVLSPPKGCPGWTGGWWTPGVRPGTPASALAPFAGLDAVLDDLSGRGWLAGTDGDPALTDIGRAARRRLLAEVTVLRRRTTDGVGADEYVHAVAALDRMVANAESVLAAALPSRVA